jgi:general secretion pathway protein A
MYTEHYGLTGKPFQLTPDLRFFYPSRGHQRARSYLRYGLEQGEGFVVITGHVGTGKTLLIQTLLREIADQNIACARIATANLAAERLPAAVASALGLPFEGKSKEAIARSLERSLRKARNSLDHVLLVVDEAQTLRSDVLEELRILSNLEAGGRALLQVFLIGQSELQRNLRQANMSQLRQRIVASYHLEPLSDQDTRRYIAHRLHAVGWSGKPSFGEGAWARIHGATQGVPRKINILMDRLMLFGYLEELFALDESHVDTVLEELQVELAGDLAHGEDEVDAVDSIDPVLPRASSGDAVASGGERARGAPTALESRLRALEQKLDKLSSQSNR